MPTLLELTDGTQHLPYGVDGVSMATTLIGEEQPPRDYLYREFPAYGGQQSIRIGDWKAIRQKLATGNVSTELYNLREDIGESNDVAAMHPERVKRMESMMTRVRTPSKEFPLVPFDKPAAKGKRGKKRGAK